MEITRFNDPNFSLVSNRDWEPKDIFEAMRQPNPSQDVIEVFICYLDAVDAEKLVQDLTKYCHEKREKPENWLPNIISNFESCRPEKIAVINRLKAAQGTVFDTVIGIVAERAFASSESSIISSIAKSPIVSSIKNFATSPRGIAIIMSGTMLALGFLGFCLLPREVGESNKRQISNLQ